MYESVFESGIKKEKPMPEKKERLYVRLLALSALVFLLSQSFELYGADLKIKVIVRSANIRLKPSLDSPVIGKGLSGQVFTVIKKIGEWYSINLPPDKEGIVLSGFVHQSVVQEMVEDTGRRAQQTEPKPEPEKKAVIQE
ncbi:MAG: SH3 domain-containing protein, partial [Candidatus Aminicenantes bacterium]|nr:SH3 domain-containing protein [Candidatus Aminicenantes bacterium]